MSPGETQIVQAAFKMLLKTLCLIKPCSGSELTFRQVFYESEDGCANPGYFCQVRVSHQNTGIWITGTSSSQFFYHSHCGRPGAMQNGKSEEANP